MSARLRSIAVALGATTMAIPAIVEPLVRPEHNLAYHWSGSPSALFGPVAVNVLAIWAILALLLLSADKPGRWRAMLWAGILLVLPLSLVRDLMACTAIVPRWVKMPPIWVALLVWVAVVLLWRPRFENYYEAVIDVASTVLEFAALSALFFVSEFAWCWWGARSLNVPPPLHREQVAAVAPKRPRIIWIVLDELSYQQVYEHRYPGLQLPEFDALAKHAAVFTQVTPAANYTDRALPSLLSGKPIDEIRSTRDGQLLLKLTGVKGWHQFEQHDTVFQDALSVGYSTAVAGWFNPYCRIMPAVLDRCYWADAFSEQDRPMSKGPFRLVLATSLGMWIGQGSVRRLVDRALRVPGPRVLDAALHIKDYQDLSVAADHVLLDQNAEFIFLHLPIPHPEGIYDRATGKLTTGSSTYIDNLVLADKYLAHVRELMNPSGQWESSTIIVMGDHGWRTTLLWEDMKGWTPEEQRASLGGKFDTRPGYIVKLPGQQTGDRIDEPFDAIRTRALVDELMSGKIHSPQDLKNWVDQGGGANQKDASDMHH